MAAQTIGRAEDCALRINDLSVSRHHAEIEKLGANRFLLRDLDSTYGTKVYREGEWVEILEIEIKKDTPIRFGDHETTVTALMGGAMDDEIATNKPEPSGREAAEPSAGADAPKAERKADKPAKKGGLGKLVKAGRAKGLGGNNRMMWYLIGGFGALIVVVAITAAVLYFLDRGPSEAEIRSEFVATCQARGTTPERCQCEVDFIMSQANRREQLVLLFLAQNRGDTERLRQYLNDNFSAEERNMLRGRLNQLILGIDAQCRAQNGEQQE